MNLIEVFTSFFQENPFHEVGVSMGCMGPSTKELLYFVLTDCSVIKHTEWLSVNKGEM